MCNLSTGSGFLLPVPPYRRPETLWSKDWTGTAKSVARARWAPKLCARLAAGQPRSSSLEGQVAEKSHDTQEASQLPNFQSSVRIYISIEGGRYQLVSSRSAQADGAET